MTAVKGSKQYRMMVVPYRPYRRLVWGLALSLLAVVAVAVSYLGGEFKGQESQRAAIIERDRLQLELRDSSSQVEALRQQAANLTLGSEVDRRASEEVRTEVIALKAHIAELEADISFYRGLMAPTANKRGLTIGSLNVVAAEPSRTYEYSVVIQQLATSHKLLTGYLNFDVVGKQAGVAGAPSVARSIPLMDLTDKVSFNNIKLRFKYFQTLRGRLVLPEGFEPERIELLAKSAGKDSVTVKKKFGWLVQES